jgi:hypothetical protein
MRYIHGLELTYDIICALPTELFPHAVHHHRLELKYYEVVINIMMLENVHLPTF